MSMMLLSSIDRLEDTFIASQSALYFFIEADWGEPYLIIGQNPSRLIVGISDNCLVEQPIKMSGFRDDVPSTIGYVNVKLVVGPITIVTMVGYYKSYHWVG